MPKDEGFFDKQIASGIGGHVDALPSESEVLHEDNEEQVHRYQEA